ncbi:MAG: hypothetical protein WBB01_03580 [Phormidesmis sp.]
MGISMNHACTSGIGFWHEHYLHKSISDIDTQLCDSGSPAQQAMAQRRIKQAQDEMAIRIPEIKTIQQIFEAVQAQSQLPLRLALDVKGSFAYDFEIGFRRTLAYALAYEASIAAGSLAPYDSVVSPLIVGDISELRKATPLSTDRYALSIYLNLLSKLNAAAAYQRRQSNCHPDLPGEVNQLEIKRAFLTESMQEAAGHRSKTLTKDGKLSIQALLKEVQLNYDQNIYSIAPQLWGQIAPSHAYIDKLMDKPYL